MNIQNSNFFVSLFSNEASGSVVFETSFIKIEFDVKHSEYDYGKTPFYVSSCVPEKSQTTKRCIYSFIPIRYGCQGIKINCFIRK